MEVKMMDNNERQIKTGILAMLVAMLIGSGNEGGAKWLRACKEHVSLTDSTGEFRATRIIKKMICLSDKPDGGHLANGKLSGKYYRYMADMIGELEGKVFYTLSGTSGFNASNIKSVSIAILSHYGITNTNGKLILSDGKGNSLLGDLVLLTKLDSLFRVVKETEQTFSSEVTTFSGLSNDEDDDEEDEFTNANIKVMDEVVDYDPLTPEGRALYPLEGLVMSFFALIKVCGSATGTVLNYAFINSKAGNPKIWRPSAIDAIAKGDKTYHNKKGTLKEIKCITDYVDEGTAVHNSVFPYALSVEILLKCLHFNLNKVKDPFYHMANTFCAHSIDAKGNSDKGVRMAMRLTAAMLRMVVNAVENGAPKNEIGVGFVKYLDEDTIQAVLDELTTGDFFERLGKISGGNNRSVDVTGFDDDVLV